jgi:hypothetical protein
MRHFPKLFLVGLAWILVLGITPGRGSIAWADTIGIGPGFDLFHTTSGTNVFIPNIGTIQLTGLPIGPANTDTIVQRKQGCSLNPGDTCNVPIELVALSLQSVTPIQISNSFFDVFVTLTPNTSSSGGMTITRSGTADGTFNSFFDVFFDITLQQVGNPSNKAGQSFRDRITGFGTWSTTPPPQYPSDPRFPSGGFFPGPLSEKGTHFSLVHNVVPSQIPEPGTMLLLGTGLAAAFLKHRRRTV